MYEDKETEIMILGCGLSNIGAKLYEEGYFYITNVDFSSVAIDYMRNKHQIFEEMDCKCFILPVNPPFRRLNGYHRANRDRARVLPLYY